ncbi:TonB-dependent receptor [Asticcacaulis sp. 201]|uniref:TonB-dependent receptor n=1 Tax=Asticcacaulis sp. 201 TaxID=3028787 RepID=UPI002915E2CB|nr:TonB-dependent receptor [Asticcacaulis sp. 201]MDV6330724.1 TonB-dependent receptor [Asticcacaulis sp. 201]
MKITLFTSVAAVSLLSAGLVHAQDVAASSAATPSADTVTEVVVYGQGQSRQTQAIKADDITKVAPGTSPLKVLDKLPGVSFQSSDPFGAYEWSARISVRGFNQNQMGFTLDGVTLGDMSYGNYNGLHISRAIINEDIAKVDMAQGAGSLDSATSSNMGGTLKFTSRNPSKTMGGELAATVGSDSMHRVYGRFETGSIDALGGLRGYISAVDQKTDKWKGGGQQKAQQFDTKWVLPLGDTGSLSAFVNHSERREQDYQDMSFEMIKRLGYNWDNFQPNYAKAIGVASVLNNPANYLSGQLDPASGYWAGVGTNPYATYGVATPDDAYYYGAGIRNDTISAVKFDNAITDKIKINGTLYHHDNKGQGLWVTPYNASPNYGIAGATTDNAPLSVRTTEYNINRTGVIAGVAFDLGAHQVSAGVWTEDNNFHQARRYYAENLTAPKRDPLGFQSNPYFTKWEYAFNTKTTQLYVEDIWQATDALKVNYGFKSLEVTNKVNQVVGGTLVATLKSKDTFLPQVGAVYKLNSHYELFGSYAENMDAYVSAATAGPFASQSQVNVDYVKNNLKPETSKTLEGGLRFRFPQFQGVAAIYSVKFDNRILAVSQGAGILGNAPVLSNVGGVKTNGLELAGTYRFTPQWHLYAAYSYNDSTYEDDVVAADKTILAHTKGKTVVNTPKNLLKTELGYDNGTLFGTLGVNYTDKRYYTYENVGGEVPSNTLTDLTVGYRFQTIGTTLQLNVTNLTDERYISTIGSNGFVNSDASGTSQTILPGAPRQVFVSVKKAF